MDGPPEARGGWRFSDAHQSDSLASGQLFVGFTVTNLNPNTLNETGLVVYTSQGDTLGIGTVGGDPDFNIETFNGSSLVIAQTNIAPTGSHHIV